METNAQQNNSGLKAGIQKLGSYLSSMVMPNIGAFIAWGIITALFIPDGWIPNENLATLVDPMVTYLLPLLIGYSGGKMVHDKLGGVIGAIGTMGVIVGSQVPMFIGAMIIGPFSGWVIKKFDEAFFDKIPSGFEMLVNNFSVGILGFFIAIGGYLGVGPLVTTFTNLLGSGVEAIVSMGLLPLANVFIEPAKILFLNNAINHGILTPLGTQQVAEAGRSVLYLLEANPGPGLGVLLAFLLFGKGSSKSSASGAAIIHFLGGIHEIYFPYVLMKPLMFLSVIAGGVAGTFTFQMFNVGLSGAASPGSIIAILGMAPQGNHLGIILGVAISALVSFLIGMLVIKLDRSAEEDDLEAAQAASQAAKRESKGQSNVTAESDQAPDPADIDKIIFACDAGMGSSAMGASLLRKKAKQMNFDMAITNSSISQLSDDGNMLVITQEELTPRARKQAPSATHISVGNFLDGDNYDRLLAEMQGQSDSVEAPVVNESVQGVDQENVYADIQTILVGYDKKVPASAMGASILRNKVREFERDIQVDTIQMNKLSADDKTLVVVDDYLEDTFNPELENINYYKVTALYEDSAYEELIERL